MTRRRKHFLVALILSGLLASQGWAQFVPGHIFGVHHSNNFCEADEKTGIPFDTEYIFEINPETGESRIFATIPREWCGVSTGMAFSPDGKKLRVASMLLSLIWEFDAQGNRSIALDWTNGINSPDGCNCIAYDKEGNFYATSRGAAKVLRFPPNGRHGTVLARADNNGLNISSPHELAVGPQGEVYIADSIWDQIFLITPDGEVSLFDEFTEQNEIIASIVVDDIGNVYVIAFPGPLYKYVAGSNERKLLVGCDKSEICNIQTLALSADRSRIIAPSFFREIMIIDPVTGSYEELVPMPRLMSDCGMTVVPLRGDVDGDGDQNLEDLESLVFCMEGPGSGVVGGQCDSADMDADGDVDLFDVRFFLWAHSALQSSNEALMSLEARYL